MIFSDLSCPNLETYPCRIYNHCHDILRLFEIFLNFPFTTSVIISIKHGILRN